LRVAIAAYTVNTPSRRSRRKSNESEDAMPKYLFEARYTPEGAR
jgi:hypothetical protein